MAQTTFEVDEATETALSELKAKFGVKTNAQVIRKALALARVAAANTASDNSVTIVDPESTAEQGKTVKILLSA